MYYYLPFRNLKAFWDRSEAGGRKSFRFEELDPDFFIRQRHDGLIPYLDAMQTDLNQR
jgi:recombination protein U